MEHLTLFVALTGIAVLLQAVLLAGMFFALRESNQRIEAIAAEFKTKAIPAIEQVQSLVAEFRPKAQVIADNLQRTTTLARAQAERMDATVNDVVDRARLQIIRADELLTRTLDRVEQTSDLVHNTVVSPVRQFSGLMQGITAGIEFLLGNRGNKNGGQREARRPVPQDEMFI